MKINDFQIEKMKINSVILRNKKREKINEKNIKIFNQLEENILFDNHTIDFSVRVDLVSFGNFDLEDKDKIYVKSKDDKIERKLRFYDYEGNIFFFIRGIKKLF